MTPCEPAKVFFYEPSSLFYHLNPLATTHPQNTQLTDTVCCFNVPCSFPYNDAHNAEKIAMSSTSKSADQKSTVESTAATRIVPGAPPPAPLTKSQKKKLLAKRKPAHADPPVASSEGQNGSVRDGRDSAPPETPHESEHKVPPEDDVAYKPSPLAELINKRLKSTTKKIVSPDQPCKFVQIAQSFIHVTAS
jgi:hypothetical protein